MKQIYGKLIAGVLGFITLGPVGLLFGLVIGHAFDRGLWQALQAASPDALVAVQRQFLDTTFTLLGYVAKADGHISEAEITHAESLFRQLRLNPAQRQSAILRFKEGAELGLTLKQRSRHLRRKWARGGSYNKRYLHFWRLWRLPTEKLISLSARRYTRLRDF